MRVIKNRNKPTTSIRARMDVVRLAGHDPTDWTRKEIKDAAEQIDRVNYLESLKATAKSRERRGRFRAVLLGGFVLAVSVAVGFVVVSTLKG